MVSGHRCSRYNNEKKLRISIAIATNSNPKFYNSLSDKLVDEYRKETKETLILLHIKREKNSPGDEKLKEFIENVLNIESMRWVFLHNTFVDSTDAFNADGQTWIELRGKLVAEDNMFAFNQLQKYKILQGYDETTQPSPDKPDVDIRVR